MGEENGALLGDLLWDFYLKPYTVSRRKTDVILRELLVPQPAAPFTQRSPLCGQS